MEFMMKIMKVMIRIMKIMMKIKKLTSAKLVHLNMPKRMAMIKGIRITLIMKSKVYDDDDVDNDNAKMMKLTSAKLVHLNMPKRMATMQLLNRQPM